MKIVMMNNKSEVNKVGKDIVPIEEYTGYLKNDTSILNIDVVIEADKISGNYLYIRELNKYYFINDISSIRTRLWNVNASIDVLQTYSLEILNQYALIDSNRNVGNEYVDNNLKIDSRLANEIVNFEYRFNEEPTYILVVAGG